VPTAEGGKEPVDCPGGIDFTDPGFALTARMADIHIGPSRFYYSMDRGRNWNGRSAFPTLDRRARGAHRLSGERQARSDYVPDAAKSNGKEGRVISVRTRDGGKTFDFVSFVGPEPEAMISPSCHPRCGFRKTAF